MAGNSSVKMQFSRKPLVLLNSPPKYHSLVSASSALPLPTSLLTGGIEVGTAETVEELQPDVSYKKVTHRNGVSTTALLSSLDKFEDLKEDPSPPTITQQEKERTEKENKLNTAHII